MSIKNAKNNVTTSIHRSRAPCLAIIRSIQGTRVVRFILNNNFYENFSSAPCKNIQCLKTISVDLKGKSLVLDYFISKESNFQLEIRTLKRGIIITGLYLIIIKQE